ncbi:kinetochore Sim4 complex subunit FTA2-domain-containing protein [Nemania sp. FL0031]|nr:kinetochore Sim4 complex subunit FTA2-domain-containing protein [Nemania sp. FL0031]
MADLIPDTTGPKLSAFRGDIEKIEFLKYLGPDTSAFSREEVPHGRVFLVRIEGSQYALKVFNFFSIKELKPFAFNREHLIKDHYVRYHLDPFYSECRAFGRLVEKKKDDALAVRCYGYAFLPQPVEDQIERKFGIDDWNREPEDEGQPLRAIVKDYIRYKSLCGRKSLSAMRSNLEQLNRLGILNMDIKEDNYKGGRLFDFSIAITNPHMHLWVILRSAEGIIEDLKLDLALFDSMAKKLEAQRAQKRGRWSEGVLRQRPQNKNYAGISKRRSTKKE